MDAHAPARAAGPAPFTVLLLGVGGPALLAASLLLGVAPSVTDLLAAAVLAALSLAGVTVGYHRMLTHASFTAVPWLRDGLLLAGGLATVGSPIDWAAADRAHHRFSDTNADPHSPVHRGLAFAHVGWLLAGSTAAPQDWCPDLVDDRRLVRVDRAARWMPILGTLVVPALVGLPAGPRGMVVAVVWVGLIRVAVVQHLLWSINSIGHRMGRVDFDTHDRSSNVAALSVVTFGDSWHNTHHCFPHLACPGIDTGQSDPAGSLILALERRGLVHDVRRAAAGELAEHRVVKVDPVAEPAGDRPDDPPPAAPGSVSVNL